jgi:hypothetical protein
MRWRPSRFRAEISIRPRFLRCSSSAIDPEKWNPVFGQNRSQKMALFPFQIDQLMRFDCFVGIPYQDRGRSLVGLDCYGLVRLVYRELRGIDLPSHVERYTTTADQAAIAGLIAGELDPWDEIAAGSEITFDAVLLRDGRFISHVGVVVTPGLMLHVAQGETSRIERYGSGALKHRVVGFYRFNAAGVPE